MGRLEQLRALHASRASSLASDPDATRAAKAPRIPRTPEAKRVPRTAGFANIHSDYSTTAAILAAVAIVWICYQLYKAATFIYQHFLRQSSLKRYRQNTGSEAAAWAMVTGASDGIGKAFAEELCVSGFNVILHGRNGDKLERVKEDLLRQWPNREIQLFVHDAGSDSPSKLDDLIHQVKSLQLKILINNIGGSGNRKPLWTPLQNWEEDRIQLFLDLNARFPTEVTRRLLPHLVKGSSALVLNVGSITGEIASPYLSVYAGSKAYNKAWSRSLGMEMQMEGHPNVEVLHILLGGVATTNSGFRSSNLFVPSSRRMAKAALDKVGCGRDIVYGYWPHEVQQYVLETLPAWFRDWLLMRTVRAFKNDEEGEISKNK